MIFYLIFTTDTPSSGHYSDDVVTVRMDLASAQNYARMLMSAEMSRTARILELTLNGNSTKCREVTF